MSHHSNARPHTSKSTNKQTINDALDKSVDDLDVDRTSIEKIEALVEIVCGGRHDSPAALLVLLATLEAASEPTALAHAAKHFAFTLCGELNVNGMVDAQTASFESELLAARSLVS